MKIETLEPNLGETDQKYLLFQVGEENFALPLESIRSITKVTKTTRVPNTPAYVRGVTNLKGQIITVMDLSKMFGYHDNEGSNLLLIDHDEESIGLIVDEVKDVLTPEKESILSADKGPSIKNGDQISGFIVTENGPVVILDIGRRLKMEMNNT
jgi:purine-binding chemotaxis protein CheW